MFSRVAIVNRGEAAMRLIHAVNIEEGTVAYMRQSLGIRLGGYRDKITVRPPDAREARFFDLPDSTPSLSRWTLTLRKNCQQRRSCMMAISWAW